MLIKYDALISGMDMAHDLGAIVLYVRSDSLLKLAKTKMNGEFQPKDSKMMAYLKLAKTKSEQF